MGKRLSREDEDASAKQTWQCELWSPGVKTIPTCPCLRATSLEPEVILKPLGKTHKHSYLFRVLHISTHGSVLTHNS